jgi:hypothetical protein
MEGSGYIFTLSLQPVKGLGRVGGGRSDDLNMMALERLSNGSRHTHISGIAGADYKNFRPGRQDILNIVNILTVPFSASPLPIDLTANDF